MPLNCHSYLLSQGWTGKGTGLRHGAITRPLAIPQKKTLAGLGKDRDEAFPFWDHLFSAAAKSIQLKVPSDHEDGSDSDPATDEPSFKRTATGILSNRRPVTGVSASTSGTNTPDTADQAPRPNLLSFAKREAARRVLYARFFRGPVLGPDSCDQNAGETSSTARAHDGDVLRSLDGKVADTLSGNEIDEKRCTKDLKGEQKLDQKTSRKMVRKRKEKVEEAQRVREKKKRRKQEAEAGEDSARQKKRKREQTAKVQIALESNDEKGVLPEVSEDRPKKRKKRKKSKDQDSVG